MHPLLAQAYAKSHPEEPGRKENTMTPNESPDGGAKASEQPARPEIEYFAKFTMTPGTPMQLAAAAAVAEIDALRCALDAAQAEARREREWHDRVLKSAQEVFGEDCIRYKLSLFKNGRARNYFPANIDGHWFALQRAEDDAHMGLVAMVEALRAELAANQSERSGGHAVAIAGDQASSPGAVEPCTNCHHYSAQRSQAIQLRQALDLLAGLHPCLTVGEENPLDQAEAIFESVLASHRVLTEDLERTRHTIQSLLARPRTGSDAETARPHSTTQIQEP